MLALGGFQPDLERSHRAGVGCAAPRDADAHTFIRLVALGARDQQPESVLVEGDVLVLDRDKFGAAQRTGIAEQQQRAVALTDRRVLAGCDQAAHLLGCQGRRLAYRPAEFALDAAQRVADRRIGGRPWLTGKAMRAAERGETPHQRAAGVCLRQRGEIGGDRGGRGRQCRPAGGAAPGAKMLPIGPVGA